jgi:hypothetical protein
MARRWFSSAALAVLTVGILGSGAGLGVANASSARPTTATVAQAKPASGSKLPVKVPGTLHGVSGTLNGTVPKFTGKSGNAVANFVFTSFTTKNGKVVHLPRAVTASSPVMHATNTNVCRILNLVLGPLHLNLLGLVVNLNRVHLTITAVRGPGNLLGNLLCAVANLLNGSAPAASKAGLLNDVSGTLGILGRL